MSDTNSEKSQNQNPQDSSKLGNVSDILQKPKTEIMRNQDWCNRSLEQLEMSAALLSQCLDSDLNDLNRQNAVLNQCLQEVIALKQRF